MKQVWINTDEKTNAERILLGAMLREPYNLGDHTASLVRVALATSGRYAKAFDEIFNQFFSRGTYSAATVATKTGDQEIYRVAAENPDIDLGWSVDNWWNIYKVWAEVQAFTFAQAPDVAILGADAMRAKVSEVREELGANGVFKVENYQQRFADLAVAKLEGKEEIYLTRPHLESLRAIKPHFEPGTVTIVAARPGMGKTQFMLNLYSHFLDQGLKGPLFSLEMEADVLLHRLMGIRHGWNPAAKWSDYSEDKKSLVQQAIHEVATLDTSIITDRRMIEEIEATASAAFYKGNLDFLMVDYIQLASSSRNFGVRREQEVSHISRTLVALAKRFKIPVIALSQLSRDVEKRGGSKRPGLSDLRESGSLEQDADTIMFLFRPEYYQIFEDEFGNSTKGVAEIIVAKHRNGDVGTAVCEFNPVRGFRDAKKDQPFTPILSDFVPIDYSSARPAADIDIPF